MDVTTKYYSKQLIKNNKLIENTQKYNVTFSKPGEKPITFSYDKKINEDLKLTDVSLIHTLDI